MDGPTSTDALVRHPAVLHQGRRSRDDLRTLTKEGGRGADAFYRDRWSHDKVVRSTHGVNCTGSCSWKVYVKDGIITWETQQTDYPSVGPDSPEYEPRGCPRGAAFSWYTYSPTRVRYPYVRGVLLRDVPRGQGAARRRPGHGLGAHRRRPAARQGLQVRPRQGRPGPRDAGTRPPRWSPPRTSTRSRSAGPDRVAGFSPIPAMSMVSHASGARFTSLIGGSMLSFYDWYADLPVASPQVFGDQTDVPESGDWWDAGYLIMWGSNVPVTRTPDAHWMTEARYRGQKVVVVAPDYADNVKFADEWLAAAPGTDGALAMAMGHVILKEFFVDRQTPYFADYVEAVHRPAVPGRPRARRGRRDLPRRASSSPPPTCRSTPTTENAEFKTGAARRADRRAGGAQRRRSATASATPASGKWNLDLGDVDPLLTPARPGGETVVGRAAALRRRRRDAGLAAPRRAGRAGSATAWSPRSST